MRAITGCFIIALCTSTFAASSISDASLPANTENIPLTSTVTDPNTSFTINDPTQQQPLCDPRYLGAVEDVEFITPVIFRIKSRVDTGAGLSSLHALDLSVVEENNINYAHFFTEDDLGNRYEMKERIRGVVDVTNTSGVVEKRYVVRANVILNGQSFALDVNLKDRSKMTYKFLIGRDLIRSGDFLVDINFDEGCVIRFPNS